MRGKLRKKKLKGGKLSLYIDYYPPVWNPHNKRFTRREFLNLYVHANPVTPLEVQENKLYSEIAEKIYIKRMKALMLEENGLFNKDSLDADFFLYAKSFIREKQQENVDTTHYEIAVKYLHKWMGDHCKFRHIDEIFLQKFKQDTFNTFQSQARSMFEKLDYLTITNKDMEKYEDPVFFAPNRKGIVKVNFLDRCTFYKDLFGDLSKRQLLPGQEYIYLMLNTRNNYVKIGKSIKPNFREKTLQAEEPTIVLVACWEAPAHIERELHKLFAPQRVRGEWFNLKLKDIKILKEFMEEFS